MNVKFQKNSENTVELVKFSCVRCEFGEATITRYSYSLLYLDTMTFSSSGSINLTRRESSEATDIVTLLGLSGGPKKTQTQTNKQK